LIKKNNEQSFKPDKNIFNPLFYFSILGCIGMMLHSLYQIYTAENYTDYLFELVNSMLFISILLFYNWYLNKYKIILSNNEIRKITIWKSKKIKICNIEKIETTLFPKAIVFICKDGHIFSIMYDLNGKYEILRKVIKNNKRIDYKSVKYLIG
jgi:hypothetical protein